MLVILKTAFSNSCQLYDFSIGKIFFGKNFFITDTWLSFTNFPFSIPQRYEKKWKHKKMDNKIYHPFNFFCRSLHVKKETLRLHVYVSTFRVIIVSTPIHFLLRSITQWRFFRYTTPWGNSYSLITWLSSRMPPQLFLAGLEVFGKNIVKLAV